MPEVEGCGSKEDPGWLIICILSSEPESHCSDANRQALPVLKLKYKRTRSVQGLKNILFFPPL